MSTPDIKRRQIISYPLVTTLSGLALKNMMENVQKMMIDYGFSIPFEVFIFTIVFFATILRFFIGNILHLRSLEEHKTSSTIWLCDLLVITFESMLFILMSYFIYNRDVYFAPILAILCIVDALWVFSMFPHWRRHQRPEMPWGWGMINLASFLFLFPMVFASLPVSPISSWGRYAILGWFLFFAFVDLGLDYYKILRKIP
jgi:hypothetical protein